MEKAKLLSSAADCNCSWKKSTSEIAAMEELRICLVLHFCSQENLNRRYLIFSRKMDKLLEAVYLMSLFLQTQYKGTQITY